VSDPFPLADHLLSRSRLMLQVGRPRAARRFLRRLTSHPDFAPRTRAEAHRRLSEIDLVAGRFRRARRHLVAAIRLRRHADELYFEYARAIEADPNGDPRKAVSALRVAVGIDPFEVRSWALLGHMAAAAGDLKLALKALRRAVRLRPEPVEVLADVVKGFLDLGRRSEARAVLSAARFRARRDARITGLWDWFRFDQAVREQRSQRLPSGPSILRFPTEMVDVPVRDGEPVVLRADRRSHPTPHVLRMLYSRPDPRQAK
jgi:tetratricopeptide (TPR) repeat protein